MTNGRLDAVDDTTGIIVCVCNTNDRGRRCDFNKSVFHFFASFSMINKFSP